MKVLVSDKLGEKGLQILKEVKEFEVDLKPGLSPDELKKEIGQYEGIVIRSGTKLKADILEAATNLRVIGRAGVGVDNVDLDQATKQGIIVMNTPEGNTVSTCELSFSMMMAMSRNIPQAHASLKAGEWERSKFTGQELLGKTLGVVGFGRIGREMTKRALAFGMNVITFDPFVTQDFAQQFGADAVSFEELCKQVDYITLHTPLTKDTKYLLNKKAFDLMKDGVRIVNCARGGIVNEADLEEALKSGKVKAAALDVFEKEPPLDSPLLKLDNVVVTPHLGASTPEAQENVAIDVAKQVRDALLEIEIRNAVNMPSMDEKSAKVLKPWVALAEKLGSFLSQLTEGSLKNVTIRYSGEVTKYKLAPLTHAILKGLLEEAMGNSVNFVNAPLMAKDRGIKFTESKTSEIEDFANFISLEIETDKEKQTVEGTLFGNNEPRIVRINDFYLDAVPKGEIILLSNEDKPGIIGEVCIHLGKHNINIAEMALGRKEAGGQAITIFNVDEEVSVDLIEQIQKLPKIISVKGIHL